MKKEITDYLGAAGINFTVWGLSVSELLNPMLSTVSLLIGITIGTRTIIKWFRKDNK